MNNTNVISGNDTVPSYKFFNFFDLDNRLTNFSYGAIHVVMEMSLTFVSIILNLTVLISIREIECLLKSTVNLMLANVCFSNLLTAVFVKSIAIIYNGYAIASRQWNVELVFCTVHSLTSRLTWAVFPYTIVILSWLCVVYKVSIITKIITEDLQHNINLKPITLASRQEFDVEKEEIIGNLTEEIISNREENPVNGLYGRQKIIVGVIWIAALAYSLLSPKIFSKNSQTKCSLRDDLTDDLTIISLFLIIPIPLITGPILSSLVIVGLSFCSFIIHLCYAKEEEDIKLNSSSKYPFHTLYCLLFIFTAAFALIYSVNMYFAETYFGFEETMFEFMSFKYTFGYFHLILIPFFILITQKDILSAVSHVFRKKMLSVSKEEITFEALQTYCGIGVNPS